MTLLWLAFRQLALQEAFHRGSDGAQVEEERVVAEYGVELVEGDVLVACWLVTWCVSVNTVVTWCIFVTTATPAETIVNQNRRYKAIP